MTGVIQSVHYDPCRRVAMLVVLDEFSKVWHVHVNRGPLFHAIIEGKLRVGDIIEHATVETGTMPMVAVTGEGRPS